MDIGQSLQLLYLVPQVTDLLIDQVDVPDVVDNILLVLSGPAPELPNYPLQLVQFGRILPPARSFRFAVLAISTLAPVLALLVCTLAVVLGAGAVFVVVIGLLGLEFGELAGQVVVGLAEVPDAVDEDFEVLHHDLLVQLALHLDADGVLELDLA